MHKQPGTTGLFPAVENVSHKRKWFFDVLWLLYLQYLFHVVLCCFWLFGQAHGFPGLLSSLPQLRFSHLSLAKPGTVRSWRHPPAKAAAQFQGTLKGICQNLGVRGVTWCYSPKTVWKMLGVFLRLDGSLDNFRRKVLRLRGHRCSLRVIPIGFIIHVHSNCLPLDVGSVCPRSFRSFCQRHWFSVTSKVTPTALRGFRQRIVCDCRCFCFDEETSKGPDV